MKWHMSFLDTSRTEHQHRTTIFKAKDLAEAQHKVEIFCEIEFGHLFTESIDFKGELTSKWISDVQYRITTNIDSETIVMGNVVLITNNQWQENKQKSLLGGETVAGELLLADMLYSKNNGFSQDEIVDRIKVEYDEWVVEEVSRALNKNNA